MVALNRDAAASGRGRPGITAGHRRHRLRAARPPVQDGPRLGRHRGDRRRRGALPGRRPRGARGRVRQRRHPAQPGLGPSAPVQPVDEDELLLLADAQTSGGLLLAGEIPGAPVIGEFVARRESCRSRCGRPCSAARRRRARSARAAARRCSAGRGPRPGRPRRCRTGCRPNRPAARPRRPSRGSGCAGREARRHRRTRSGLAGPHQLAGQAGLQRFGRDAHRRFHPMLGGQFDRRSGHRQPPGRTGLAPWSRRACPAHRTPPRPSRRRRTAAPGGRRSTTGSRCPPAAPRCRTRSAARPAPRRSRPGGRPGRPRGRPGAPGRAGNPRAGPAAPPRPRPRPAGRTRSAARYRPTSVRSPWPPAAC